ncbi:hypothetical protein EVS84_23905 [Pseudomonas koreensis]|uniref:Uncharacterized protein n=1 Tax=Pseudomonas koreensis TaxID=198620 RepID=A0A4Q4KXF0_9PSED|nr:hypothetical protein EVS84_23905 [Pseudomonas koreensis]
MRSLVGASLLAKAVFQATSSPDVPASSRAGSLPQVIMSSRMCGDRRIRPSRPYVLGFAGLHDGRL